VIKGCWTTCSGTNGLLLDVLKCGGRFSVLFNVLFWTVWEDRSIPSEWRGALLVHLAKKRGFLVVIIGEALVSWISWMWTNCLLQCTDCNWWLKKQSLILSVGSKLAEVVSV